MKAGTCAIVCHLGWAEGDRPLPSCASFGCGTRPGVARLQVDFAYTLICRRRATVKMSRKSRLRWCVPCG